MAVLVVLAAHTQAELLRAVTAAIMLSAVGRVARPRGIARAAACAVTRGGLLVERDAASTVVAGTRAATSRLTPCHPMLAARAFAAASAGGSGSDSGSGRSGRSGGSGSGSSTGAGNGTPEVSTGQSPIRPNLPGKAPKLRAGARPPMGRMQQKLLRPEEVQARHGQVYLPTREDQVESLRSGDEYDVLIIGGGATGAGAALDAATRGLSVACVERGDFASETSSRSTKLIWAGIRYIGTAVAALLQWRSFLNPKKAWDNFIGEFKMVLGAHRERRFLLETQPHLTNWVPIAVPINKWFMWPAPMGHPIFSLAPVTLPLVFKFYDSLSKFTCPPSHVLGKKAANDKFPQLSRAIKYASVFYEGQHNDARTNTTIALTAAAKGAHIANYVEVVGMLKDGTGKVVGVRARDHQAPEGVDPEFDIHAKSVVLCGGPFTDPLRALEDADSKPAVSGAAGTHIVLPGYYCPRDMGLLDINTSDGRFLFFLPWLGSTIVGTTDRKGTPTSDPAPPEDEIQWILNEVSKYLSPDLRVRRTDVLSAWQGWRPLATDPNAPPGAPASRDHIISTNPATGVTFITGGKWTTYREMAEDVIDRVVKDKGFKHAGPCVTMKTPLLGAEGYDNTLPVRLIQHYGIGEDVANHLCKTYGTHAWDVCERTRPTGLRWPRFGKLLVDGYPYIESEVKIAVTEYCRTVTDVLTLRTRLAFLNKEAASSVIDTVGEIMQRKLGWSDEVRKQQVTDARAYMDHFAGPVPNKEHCQLRAATPTDVRELFDSLDRDGNGYLCEPELKEAAQILGFPFESDEAAAAAFATMDKISDGRVDFDEFQAWWNESDSDLQRKLGARFEMSADKIKETGGSGVMFG